MPPPRPDSLGRTPLDAATADNSSASATALRVLGTLAAPAAALTALMYYFGVLHAYWFFTRFGVDYTVMGLTPDYVLRSADGLFVPLTACGAAGLAGLWIWRLLPVTAPARLTPLGTPLLPALGAVLGLALLLVTLAAVVRPALLDEPLGVPGLALAAGVLILAAASRSTADRRRSTDAVQRRRLLPLPVAVAEWAAIFLLVSAGLFWAAGDYSAAVGTRRGNDVIAALPTWPDVTVFAEKSLNLPFPFPASVSSGAPMPAAHSRTATTG